MIRKKYVEATFWSNKINPFSIPSLKIIKVSQKTAGERKVFERFEVTMIAMDNYFFSYQWHVQIHYLSQHAATFGFLINKLPNKHKMQSSGILKLLAYRKYLISKVGVYGLYD